MINELDYNDKYQKELAKILRAKRIENGMNLEELSEGICSISYLSRMENGFVKMQEPYVKKLFEKLNIDYEVLKKSRQSNLFLDIIKKNLLNQTSEYQKLLNQIATENHYLDIEQELILLYDALLNKRYDEVEMVMEEIDKAKYIFSVNEKIFYMYLIARYYFETKQINLAYHHLKSLLLEKIEEEVLYWVIFELNMSLNFMIGNDYSYINDYFKFIKDAPHAYFSKYFEIHKYKMTVLLSKDNYNEAIRKMKMYGSELVDNDLSLKVNYLYHLGLIYMIHMDFEKVLKELQNNMNDSSILMLCSIAYMNVENNKLYQNIENKINSYGFSKYEELIKSICLYVNHKIHNKNIISLQSILKNKIFKQLENSFDKYLDDIFTKELVMLNIRCSKYKEACNLMVSSFEYKEVFR